MDQHYLAQSARVRFQEISRHLDRRLRELHEQGAITHLDYQKMRSDAMQSGQAVVSAIQNEDGYPPEMQRELIGNLIALFEDSTTRILQDAELRLLEPNALLRKMSAIDASIAAGYGASAEAWLRSNPPEIERLHGDFLSNARAIGKNRPEFTIEDVYKSYERSSHELFQQLSSKISVKSLRPDESTIRITEKDVEESNGGEAEKPQDRGFFDKFFGRRSN